MTTEALPAATAPIDRDAGWRDVAAVIGARVLARLRLIASAIRPLAWVLMALAVGFWMPGSESCSSSSWLPPTATGTTSFINCRCSRLRRSWLALRRRRRSTATGFAPTAALYWALWAVPPHYWQWRSSRSTIAV